MDNSWPLNVPDSLEEICIRFCVKNLEILATNETVFKHKINDSNDLEEDGSSIDFTSSSKYKIRPGVFLHKAICDHLLEVLIEEVRILTDNYLAMFSNNQATQLSRVDLRYSQVSAEGLRMLSSHPIIELSMHCQWQCLPLICNMQSTLRCLRLDKMTSVVDSYHHLDQDDRGDGGFRGRALGYRFLDDMPNMDDPASEDHYRLYLPKLRKLMLQELNFGGSPKAEKLVTNLLMPLKHLTHLTLATCIVRLEELACLGSLTGLVSLNLSNIQIFDFPAVLRNLSGLQNLQHLDLSQGDEDIIPVLYQNSSTYLKEIVETFPSLTSLDISGTNLAGFEPPELVCHRMEAPKRAQELLSKKQVQCSIPGLENRHLEFLGLLGCAYAACSRNNIPATRVTGDANPSQVVLAVQVYLDNQLLLIKALNDLFNLFRFSTVPNHCIALEAILAAMKNNPTDSSVQIAGSASLFYIAKGDQKRCITYKHKRAMITLLLKAMHEHHTEQTMMRNACLTLCHLNLPYDVMFCYERLVKELLDMLKFDFRDEFIHRLGIFLLNCLACQVDGKEKEMVGNMGAVNTMLSIIDRKLMGEECDDVLEVAWSTLWNVTDETPSNCEKFMEQHGMQLFVRCLQKFKDKPELLRNMMGLMGNIAEVDYLRTNLMQEEYVKVFSELLDSKSDGIEVSYNACGVLSHLCFDGADSWKISSPSRLEVLNRMESAINRWPLNSKRNINYRSFEPILKLVAHFETPQVQHWAVWALCNLTAVSPEKYCKLLEKEGGRIALQNVLIDSRPYKRIRDLVDRILRQLDNPLNNASDNEGDEYVVEVQEGEDSEDEDEDEELEEIERMEEDEHMGEELEEDGMAPNAVFF